MIEEIDLGEFVDRGQADARLVVSGARRWGYRAPRAFASDPPPWVDPMSCGCAVCKGMEVDR